MAKKNYVQSEFKDYTDKSTGEVKSIETKKLVNIKIGRDETFWITYCKHIAPIYELTYADDIKIMVKFCEIAEYESGIVHLTAGRRKEMVEQLGMQPSNVSKSLKRLKEKNLIIGDNGEYRVSHLIFWKGDRSKRLDLLRNQGLSMTFNFVMDDSK